MEYFNSQPLKKADLGGAAHVSHISIHILTRRLTGSSTGIDRRNACFNSQPHEEADLSGTMNIKWKVVFQLTASRGGWPFFPQSCQLTGTFQLTASRGGWRFKSFSTLPSSIVSTHSLTRRLTIFLLIFLSKLMFQLTASRGGWPNRWKQIIRWSCFNSQPHEEADLDHFYMLIDIFRFNSQPHEEADEYQTVQFIMFRTFQLTASRGGWLAAGTYHLKLEKFQLTASRGGWQFTNTGSGEQIPFQLTASRGGWHGIQEQHSYLFLFQLTASRGGWHTWNYEPNRNQNVSTHSLTRRLTGLLRMKLSTTLQFQLTASRGGWQGYAI